MICPECKSGQHAGCVESSKNKDYSHCDCQHRTAQRTIVLPEKEAVNEQPVTAAGPAQSAVLFTD